MSESNTNFFIGVDGGKSGGIAIINKSQQLIYYNPMPLVDVAKGNSYDINKIIKILDIVENKTVFLEEAHVMFGNGIKGAFTNGELFGMMKAILVVKKIPFELVKARTWQKKLFEGQIVKDSKGAAIAYCQNKYPGKDFRRTLRSKKIHDGITDAICVANYGALRYK